MNWIKVEDKLPPYDKYVLVRLNITNWRDSTDQYGVYFKVCKLVNSWQEPNNKKPYSWKGFGPESWWGQEVSHWCEIDEIPKDKL